MVRFVTSFTLSKTVKFVTFNMKKVRIVTVSINQIRVENVRLSEVLQFAGGHRQSDF